MFPQIAYSQYGSSRSYYGNIQYGTAPKLFQPYGAWPEERPAQAGMLVEDWQELVVAEIATAQPDYSAEIASRIETIRALKQQVEAETDLRAKNELRERLRIEREAKEQAFKLRTLVDEEESLFMLLH